MVVSQFENGALKLGNVGKCNYSYFEADRSWPSYVVGDRGDISSGHWNRYINYALGRLAISS